MFQRALAVACAALIGLGNFISMSRAAVVAMIVMLLVLLYRMRARWHIVGVIVVLLMVSTLMPDAFHQRMNAVISGEDDSGSGRLDIWRIGLRAFEERSLFLGAGLDNFPVLYEDYSPGSGKSAHNMYLGVLVDLGIPGLAMMLAAIASGLLAVWRARSTNSDSIALSALEAACVGMLMASLFGDLQWRKTFWLTWILLAWATYAEKRSDDTPDALVPHG
jgi:O-antigen ligase